MQKARVRMTVDALGREERVYLEAYLKVKNLTEDADFKGKSAERLKAMRDGEALSSSALNELSQSLADKGL